MNRSQCYLSTIDSNAHDLAEKHGMGLEIAEFCTAWNMDEQYSQVQPDLERKLERIPNRILHGPYNELFPCAIDKKARELAAFRYSQAASLAKRYRARKLVIHGGYNPWIYYPCWYTEQSIVFWKEYLCSVPEGIEICLENVLEEEPFMLRSIVEAVNDPRLRICLDIGHINAYSRIPAKEWLETCSPWISHFHIHNNDADRDAHQPLHEGSLNMKDFLTQADRLCPDATYTLELMDGRSSVQWMEASVFGEGSLWKND